MSRIYVNTIKPERGGTIELSGSGDITDNLNVTGKITVNKDLTLGGSDSDSGTPVSGYGVLYVKNDILYFRNDNGSIFDLTQKGASNASTFSVDTTFRSGENTLLSGPIKVDDNVDLKINSDSKVKIKDIEDI
tara:strand:+ start:1421 stop:1819 length:399 start_codon:yes stop_codon:yes gene_type:complete